MISRPRRSTIFGTAIRSSPLTSVARAREASTAALIRTARAKRPKSRSTRWKLVGDARRLGAVLLADDEEHAVLDQDAQPVGGDARDVDDDLDGVLGLEHVQGRRALARHVGPPVRAAPGQIVEQPAHFVGRSGGSGDTR